MNRSLCVVLLAMMAAAGHVQAQPAPAPAEAKPTSAQVPSPSPVTKQLQQLYVDYNQALLNKDGAKAAGYLHSNIVQTYADALELAKTANREQLQAAAPHKRLIAFYVRWAAPQELLDNNDPREVIAFMVREGVLRSYTDVSTEVRDLDVKGDEATGQLYGNGRKTNLQLRFAKERGDWKIDLTDLNVMADDIYTQTAKMQHVSVDEALLNLVQVNTKKPITDEIWQPLNQRKRPKA